MKKKTTTTRLNDASDAAHNEYVENRFRSLTDAEIDTVLEMSDIGLGQSAPNSAMAIVIILARRALVAEKARRRQAARKGKGKA